MGFETAGHIKGLSSKTRLPFAAVIPPAVLRLGPFEVERVPAGLIAGLGVNQHTGHVLGVDGKHETTVGARL